MNISLLLPSLQPRNQHHPILFLRPHHHHHLAAFVLFCSATRVASLTNVEFALRRFFAKGRRITSRLDERRKYEIRDEDDVDSRHDATRNPFMAALSRLSVTSNFQGKTNVLPLLRFLQSRHNLSLDRLLLRNVSGFTEKSCIYSCAYRADFFPRSDETHGSESRFKFLQPLSRFASGSSAPSTESMTSERERERESSHLFTRKMS